MGVGTALGVALDNIRMGISHGSRKRNAGVGVNFF